MIEVINSDDLDFMGEKLTTEKKADKTGGAGNEDIFKIMNSDHEIIELLNC